MTVAGTLLSFRLETFGLTTLLWGKLGAKVSHAARQVT